MLTSLLADIEKRHLPPHIIQGAGSGALTIDAVAQDGMFLVDNVTLYPDEQVANELTPEADWKRRGLYMGPAVGAFLFHLTANSSMHHHAYPFIAV